MQNSLKGYSEKEEGLEKATEELETYMKDKINKKTEIEEPLISVIIPCYNGEKFVGDAIESVINQTYQDWELFIVDDASTDGSKEIIRQYVGDSRVKLVEHEYNKGISRTRNTGIKLSRGDYIALLDQDDVWFSNKLEVQINCFKKSQEKVGIVCTGMIFTDEKLKPQRNFRGFKCDAHRELIKNAYLRPANSASVMMIKKDCFSQLGLFDENLHGWDDFEMWMRIATQYRIKYIKEAMVKKRMHPRNAQNLLEVRRERKKVFEHILQLHPFLKDYVKTKEAISLYGEALELLERGEQASARERLRRSVKSNPWCFKALSLYVLSFLPGQASLRVKAVISTIINRALLLVIFIRIWARKISKI